MTKEELEQARDEILGTNYGEVQCHETTMRTAVDAINAVIKGIDADPVIPNEITTEEAVEMLTSTPHEEGGCAEWMAKELLCPFEALNCREKGTHVKAILVKTGVPVTKETRTVIYARWIKTGKHKNIEGFETDIVECSNCHDESDCRSIFCPTCGARMDVKILTEEEKFNNGDWAEDETVEKLTGLSFEECCHKFDWSREAKWNPAPLNGQNITIRFRKKKDANHE